MWVYVHKSHMTEEGSIPDASRVFLVLAFRPSGFLWNIIFLGYSYSLVAQLNAHCCAKKSSPSCATNSLTLLARLGLLEFISCLGCIGLVCLRCLVLHLSKGFFEIVWVSEWVSDQQKIVNSRVSMASLPHPLISKSSTLLDEIEKNVFRLGGQKTPILDKTTW